MINALKSNFLFFLILLFALPFSACQTKEEQERVTRAQRRAIFVEDSLSFKVALTPSSDGDAIRLAAELGIFDSLGVTVHLKQYKALSECRNALRKRLVEGAAIDSTLAKVIEDKDTTKLLLGPATSLSWQIISSKKSRILRVSQLSDKVIAADSHGASHALAEQAIDSLLKKQKRVFIVQVEDPVVRYDMLHQGNVDAAVLPEPYATDALAHGHKLLVDASKERKGVLVFRDKALKDKRIKAQYDLFLKGLHIAQDSLAARRK